MTHLESDECIRVLIELFPQAELGEAELKLFREEILKFDRDDVVNAIREHRLTARFSKPEFRAIFARTREIIRNKPTFIQPRSKKFKTVIAEGVANNNPQFAHEPEPVLVMYYHRHWWKRYLTESCTPKSRPPEATTEQYQAYLDDLNKRMDDRRESTFASLVTDLKSAGLDESSAKHFAGLLFTETDEFKAACDSLRVQCRAESQEVPEFA